MQRSFCEDSCHPSSKRVKRERGRERTEEDQASMENGASKCNDKVRIRQRGFLSHSEKVQSRLGSAA